MDPASLASGGPLADVGESFHDASLDPKSTIQFLAGTSAIMTLYSGSRFMRQAEAGRSRVFRRAAELLIPDRFTSVPADVTDSERFLATARNSLLDHWGGNRNLDNEVRRQHFWPRGPRGRVSVRGTVNEIRPSGAQTLTK